jgi:hypothetical protein
LLKNETDCLLFEHYCTSTLVHVSLAPAQPAASVLPLPPGLYKAVSVSPDSRYLLVEALHRPFSYLVPHYRFPVRKEVWALGAGEAATPVFTLCDLPLAEDISISFDACRKGPRHVSGPG